MAAKKEVAAVIKLQCAGGQATPAPPVGTALGPQGINIGEFVKQFNDRTKDKIGLTIPAVITIFADRTFTFELKSPPASVLIRKAVGLEKGASEIGTEIVGTITRAQIEEIVEIKREDLNAASLDAACRIIAGTARSMGVRVAGDTVEGAPPESVPEKVEG